MSRRRLAAATVAGLLALAAEAVARPVIPWSDAKDYVGRLVTVEGVVARGTMTPEGRCLLEFDADDASALRVYLLVPLVNDLPREPQRLFQGKRVEVSGVVTRFLDRLEMAVTPNQIEVVGLTETPPTPAPAPAATPPAAGPARPTAPPPAPAAAPAAAPRAPAAAPAPAARPAPPPPPPAPPVRTTTPPAAPPTTISPAPRPAPSTTAPPTPPTTVAPDPMCRTLDDDRAAIRAELREQNQALQECLADGRSGCAALGDKLGPLLSRLEKVEQQLARRCP